MPYSSIDPCPADSTKRSRPYQCGLRGLWRMKRVNIRYATGAIPIGIPGWPEFAFCTASIASTRIELMHSSSSFACVILLSAASATVYFLVSVSPGTSPFRVRFVLWIAGLVPHDIDGFLGRPLVAEVERR